VKILIADDSKENIYMLESLLQGYGYEVEPASDGLEALEKISKGDFDMIISDVLMPRMDGFQLCREIKKDQRLKKIPFIFYSATYTDPNDKEFALSLGAERYIVKPTEPNVFIEIIKDVIKNREIEAQAPVMPPVEDETVYLKLYNERLIKKLEDKMLELEEVNRVLKESEKKYRNLLDNANDAVVVLNDSGYINYVNPKFCEMSGYSVDEAKKLHFSKLVHPDDLDMVTEYFRKTLLDEDVPQNYEFRGQAKSGETVYLDNNVSTLHEDGVTSLLAIARDITERKRTEAKLEQSLDKLQKAMEGTIQAMALTAETRDPYTAGHQWRVAKLARSIAEDMDLPEDQIEAVYMAAIVHDIGKIYVPAEILSKPGRITEIEFNMIKTHSQVGYDILKNIEFPWPLAKIVLQHHERLDGSGYPSGLTGENILLEAKIIAVADVIEAMASHRPYRPALGIDKALEEITQNRGIIYEASIVDACLRLFKKGFSFE